MSELQPPTPRLNAGGTSGTQDASRDPGQDRAFRNGITVGAMFDAVRQHVFLFFTVTAMTLAATAFLVLNSSPLYRAKAVLHQVSERRALTTSESARQEPDRAIDPLLSMVQVLSSRTLVGQVVDSLGLQLESVSLPSSWWAPRPRTYFSTRSLQDVVVDHAAPPDTLSLQFFESGVVAVGYREQTSAVYGRPLRIGSVRFTVPKPPSVGRAALAVTRRDVAIDRVLEHLKATPRPATDVIDVRYTDRDPQLAQLVANTLAQAFQAATGNEARLVARRRREFVREQLRVTDSLLSRAEANFAGFRRRQQLAGPGAEQAAVGALDARREELEADRRVFAMLLEGLRDSSGANTDESFRAIGYAPELASDPMIGRLHQRLIETRGRLDSISTGRASSTAANPDVVYARELVGAARSELTRAVEARIAWIENRIALLGERRMRGAQMLQNWPSSEAEENRLGRRVEVLRTTADALRQEFERARMAEALEVADIEVLDLAPLPYRKTGMPRGVQLGFGLLLGMLLGLAASAMAEGMNHAVRRPEELPHALGAPELGLIPRIPPTHSSNTRPRLLVSGTGHGETARLPAELVVTWPGSPSPEAEAFRMLRISLSFQWQDGPRTLVVTSAAPQEGKTLVAANLAAAFARGGAQVLLVDCDIHRPRLHRVFRLSRSPGLMELLRPDSGPVRREVGGPPAPPTYTFAPWLARPEATTSNAITPAPSVEWHPAIRRTPIERLSVLPCGVVSSNASDLLEPARLRDRLDELHKHFDMIILDTPPVLVSADAATLAASADGVVMIVRAGSTDRGAADLAYQRLTAAGGRVLGAVLNDPDGVMSQISHKTYYVYDYPPSAD